MYNTKKLRNISVTEPLKDKYLLLIVSWILNKVSI